MIQHLNYMKQSKISASGQGFTLKWVKDGWLEQGKNIVAYLTSEKILPVQAPWLRLMIEEIIYHLKGSIKWTVPTNMHNEITGVISPIANGIALVKYVWVLNKVYPTKFFLMLWPTHRQANPEQNIGLPNFFGRANKHTRHHEFINTTIETSLRDTIKDQNLKSNSNYQHSPTA
jgi:hypothetical protein